MTHSNKVPISVKVPQSVKDEYRKYSENHKQSMSHYFRMAIYTYMENKEDFELSSNTDLIINNTERYNQSEMEQVFFEYENQIISQQLKKATFLRFMDNFLADIYLKNRQYIKTGEITRQDLKNLMKNSLEELENRAEHHGYESSFESRMEEPVKYARERIATAYEGVENPDLDGDVPDLDNDIPDLENNTF